MVYDIAGSHSHIESAKIWNEFRLTHENNRRDVLDNGKRTTLEVSVGQKVLFAKYAGTEIKMDGEEYLILRESDIMGIVE